MHNIDLHVLPLLDNTKNGLSKIVNRQHVVVSLESAYFIPIEALEYGDSLMKLRILHARLQVYKVFAVFVLGYFILVALGILGAYMNLPQCNSVRIIAVLSHKIIYAFLSSTWKSTVPGRQLLLSLVQYTACFD